MIAYIDFCKKNGIKEPENIYYELKRTKYAFLYEAYNKADAELAKQKFDYMLSGTTFNLVFQFNRYLIKTNVGDSRSI